VRLHAVSAACRRWFSDERGVAATEYAVLLALILVVAIVGIGYHGTWMADKWATMNNEMFGG
jgi:Flp pilus assembly pilin Flp